MPRALKEARLTTRSARLALPPGIHWRGIDTNIHLGYRKAVRGGRWLVRWYIDGRYRKSVLGTADDVISEGNLSFEAASKAARDYVSRVRARHDPDDELITVRMAVEAYVTNRDDRTSALAGRKIRSDAHSRMSRHVLSQKDLASLPLYSLTEDHLVLWRTKLDKELRTTTRRRLFNDLKAALNLASRQYRKSLPPDFEQIVRYGLSIADELPDPEPISRDNQILTDEQVRKIIQAAFAHDPDHDFGRMIFVLAATGARFSQVRRMVVRDVQFEQSRLMIPTSRKGRSRVASYTPVKVGQDLLNELKCAIEGRAPSEPLLLRWRHVQTSKIEWKRVDRRAWLAASELARSWKVICDMLGYKNIVPYALRHSSIVRSIRAGLPIRLVASSHDTSVLMIERHYSRWISDGLEELSAKAVVTLMPDRLTGNPTIAQSKGEAIVP